MPIIDPTARKATKIELFSLATAPMRAFHVTWLAFFVCFYAWFAAAPLMPLISKEFALTKQQVADINIAAVLVTIAFRLVIGPLCDRIGPRRTYVWLLSLGALPVFGLAFAQSYEWLLFSRLLIGAIGASFVITQYHTSVMFAPNVVGTANATVGGWGNAGGGAVQSTMPMLLTLIVGLGVEQALGWRIALFVPGVAMLIMAWVYWRFTQDTPQGDLADLRAAGLDPSSSKAGGPEKGGAVFMRAVRNYRVWMLAIVYGGCFGVEIFIHNIAATYYVDRFQLTIGQAGMAAGTFGLLALFARALGGFCSDKVAAWRGLDGRTMLLFALMASEGAGLLLFSQAGTVPLAIASMLLFGLFTHMACGATYAVMPFVDRRALGGVAGIIGAGGNAGAVLAGLLNRQVPDQGTCLLILGGAIMVTSICAIVVRFSPEHKSQEEALYKQAMQVA